MGTNGTSWHSVTRDATHRNQLSSRGSPSLRARSQPCPQLPPVRRAEGLHHTRSSGRPGRRSPPTWRARWIREEPHQVARNRGRRTRTRPGGLPRPVPRRQPRKDPGRSALGAGAVRRPRVAFVSRAGRVPLGPDADDPLGDRTWRRPRTRQSEGPGKLGCLVIVLVLAGAVAGVGLLLGRRQEASVTRASAASTR